MLSRGFISTVITKRLHLEFGRLAAEFLISPVHATFLGPIHERSMTGTQDRLGAVRRRLPGRDWPSVIAGFARLGLSAPSRSPGFCESEASCSQVCACYTTVE